MRVPVVNRVGRGGADWGGERTCGVDGGGGELRTGWGGGRLVFLQEDLVVCQSWGFWLRPRGFCVHKQQQRKLK